VECPDRFKERLWLWRKNPENLTDQEKDRLAGIEHKNLWTAKAYQMRLVFQDIYRSVDAIQAKRRFQVWCRWIQMVSRQAHVITSQPCSVSQNVLNHLQGILAHWKEKLTNAFMEGLNSVFSTTKRRARGYSSSEYLIAILYSLLASSKFHSTESNEEPEFHTAKVAFLLADADSTPALARPRRCRSA
jgi:transposase